MTVLDALNAMNEPDLVKRVKFSLVKAAIAVSSESAGARTVLAKAILNSPDAYAPRFLLAILTQVTLGSIADQTAITQASIDTQVSAVFNAFA